MTDNLNISEKVKEYLTRKLEDCRHELVKLKRKRKRIKILYVSTVVSSIIISTVSVSLTSIISVPIIVITVLSSSSAILTGVSARFNFQNKKVEINNLIDRLNKIQAKLDYVITCNGDLTQKEYQEILKDFNL
jgi:tetrahydromethanopterin S-methyltransferase subunit G